MKIDRDLPGEDVRIEIIPLIDVIFCILTFFILAAVGLTRQQAITVDIPKTSTGTSQMQEMLIVTINAAGQTFVEQDLVLTPDELRQKLRRYRAQYSRGLIILYASKTAIYSDVVQVLDILPQEGGSRIALATLPSAGDRP
ncbi:MAG: biopolymer transporter ExbD [Hormoscilla sp. SP5CHS1]|nr:biopolymer transporter ExbD [Hormoscilla sp. SP12CHS1]MBC6452098.1 biopolymer transporter ExbD [Hormoscilla sp. SP5CHS1]